jgi:two-component system chemotaxis response regulator CheY
MQTSAVDDLLILPPVLDLAAANDLLAKVKQRLAASPRLRIDASGVETITLACMQIILAALKSGSGVRVEQPSSAFVSAFEDLGLSFRTPETLPESASEPPDAVPVREPVMSKRILTIDDSKTIRDMLRLTLLDAGFEVLQAVDGIDGIEVLEKEQPIDVVITDINMPKMDGYGVIRHMRSNAAHMSTPVLVLTTESEAEKRNLAREAGATGWMVKPFDPDRLIATINKVAP